MTPTGIIHVKQGIGDVVWHLPFVRAIAAAAPGGIVTFLAQPSSHARELLAAEPSVAETLYFEHRGNELQRGWNVLQLVRLLRRCKFRTLWILDRTLRPAVAGALAGVPERIGLGLGAQRFFITNAGIEGRYLHQHPIEWMHALLAAMKIPLPSTEPALALPTALTAAIGTRYEAFPRPWIALGVGASQAHREWPAEHWLAFLDGFGRLSAGTAFIVGGTNDTQRAQSLIDASIGIPVVNACDLAVAEAAALLRVADAFVGPDSGPMNLAAAAQIPTFALFGASPVLNYSKFIHPVLPDDGGGPSMDGMARISAAQVLARIEPYIAIRSAAV